jgi:hypothetical protein
MASLQQRVKSLVKAAASAKMKQTCANTHARTHARTQAHTQTPRIPVKQLGTVTRKAVGGGGLQMRVEVGVGELWRRKPMCIYCNAPLMLGAGERMDDGN